MTRRAWIVGLVVAGLLVLSLYRAKYGAKESEAEVRELRAEIARVEDEITVLRNERTHLASPAWIGEYAQRILGMAPPRAEAIMTEEDLDRIADPVESAATDSEAGDGN